MSKYGVRTDPAGIEARTCDNIVFDSEKECIRYKELKMLFRAGIIKDLELQKRFPLVVNGVKICDYDADFTYTAQDGKPVVEDTKGYKKGDAYTRFKLKAKLMLALYGLRVLET